MRVLLNLIKWMLKFQRFNEAREILSKNIETIEKISAYDLNDLRKIVESNRFEITSEFLLLKKEKFAYEILFNRQKEKENKKIKFPETLYNSQFLKKKKRKFNEKLFQECVFLLKNYGSPQQLISFHVEKNMLYEACK